MNTKDFDFDNPDDAIAAASRLDSRGDWTASINVYRHAAERWPEYREYIRHCVDQVTKKQSLAQVLQNRSCPPREQIQDEMWSFCLRGCCLILVLGLAGMFIWTIWAIFEPGRRAERVHQAIQPGESLEDVESLLTGYHFCFYQVKTNEEWRSLSRSEFINALETASANAAPPIRLHLTFMGPSPYRVSFYVELDHAGNVTKVTNPYRWD